MAARRRVGSLSPKTSRRLRISKVDTLFDMACLLSARSAGLDAADREKMRRARSTTGLLAGSGFLVTYPFICSKSVADGSSRLGLPMKPPDREHRGERRAYLEGKNE